MPNTTDTARRGNILVVDDNPANLRLLSGMLTEHGYKVRSVIHGPMALTAVQAAPPDLILMDISMPEMDGYEVCQALKANPVTADIPVIFISAMDQIEDKVRAFAVGGVDYVSKPFQFQEVAARVETHLALKRMERELREANHELGVRLEELQARNEELDAFAHTVAHDLKNPLTSMIAASSLLEARHQDLTPEQVTRYLGMLTASSYRMNNIVQELLLLCSVRKGEAVDIAPLSMADIVEGALTRSEALIEDRQPVISKPDTWPKALGRAQWIEEVWANYISNAIKYGGTPPEITLGADVVPTEGDGRFVRFWVRDNGPGLSEADQAVLFAPFERLHQVRAEGHGLGLSIVLRIVDKLGGQVGVDSAPGEGSTFWFTLPAAGDSA